MSTEEKQKRWTDALKAKGHTPIMEGDYLEFFVYEAGHCNGPGCSTCGYATCWHCHDVDSIPDCKGGK